MRRRLNRFVFFAVSILGVGYTYTGLRLITSTPLPVTVKTLLWLIYLLPFMSVLWLPLFYWQDEDPLETLGSRLMQWVAFSSMGLLSFILVLTVLRDLVALGFWLGSNRTPFFGNAQSALVLAAAIVLLILGILLARRTPAISRVAIPIEDLPPSLEGLRIAQISDVHVGSTVRRNFVETVVGIVNSLDVDLIAITGDLIDGTVDALRSETEPLKDLRARLGKYYVTGNHEYYWDAPGWIREMARLGITPLVNQHRVLEKNGANLIVAGIPDIWAGRYDGGTAPDPKRARAGAPEKTVSILLSHQPQIAPLASECGYDLQLSGHTHGGQFIPWTFIIKMVQRYPRGLYNVGRMKLYVNRGTGYWGPPVRLGSRSEISLFTLTNPKTERTRPGL